jgi:hypothetical protein
MVAWGIFELTAAWRHQKVIVALGAAVVLVACGWATWVQVGYWRNSETLFTHTIRVTGPNYIAYHHLGTDMVNRGHLDQALALYQQTLSSRLSTPRPITTWVATWPSREGLRRRCLT